MLRETCVRPGNHVIVMYDLFSIHASLVNHAGCSKSNPMAAVALARSQVRKCGTHFPRSSESDRVAMM